MTRSKKIVSIVLTVAALIFCLTLSISAFAASSTPSVSAPKNLKVAEQSDGSIRLTWANVSGATNYDIYWASASATMSGKGDSKSYTYLGDATKSPYTDTRTIDKSGSYRVVAKKNADTSEMSDPVFVSNYQLKIYYYTASTNKVTVAENSKYKLNSTTYGWVYTKDKNVYYVHSQNFNSTQQFTVKNERFFGISKTGYELTGYSLRLTPATGSSSIDTGIKYDIKDKLTTATVWKDVLDYLVANPTVEEKYGRNPFTGNISVNLYMIWEPITHDIKYNLGGGEFPNPVDTLYTRKYGTKEYTFARNPTKMKYNTAASGATSIYAYINYPTRAGYTFAGWTITGLDDKTHYVRLSFDNDTQTTFTNTEITPQKNNNISNAHAFTWLRSTKGAVKFTANWTPVHYTITYKWSDGTVISTIPAQDYTLEKSVSFAKIPALTGYKVKGWFSDAACKTKAVKPSAKVYGNMTVYAQKTPITYKVNYKYSDGSSVKGVPSTAVSYTYGKGLTLPTVPTLDYYKVEGWYSDKNCTTKVTKIAATQTKDVTIYAKRTPYNVKTAFVSANSILADNKKDKYELYNGWYNLINNGGHYWVNIPSDKPRTMITVEELGLSKTHNTFVGWELGYYNSTASAVIYTGKIYKLKVNDKGVVTSKFDAKAISKDLLAYVAANPEKTSKYNLDLKTNLVTIVLRAKWNPDKYTISYNWGDNCGTDSGKVIPNSYPVKYEYGTTESFAELPALEGYTVTGWFTDKACTKKASALSATSTTNYVLYAKKTPITYNITYNYVTPDGTIVAYKYLPTTTYTTDKDTVLATPTVPSAYKALVNGKWYTNPACTSSTATKIYKGTTGDKMYYTKVSQEYTITYKWDNGETIKDLTPKTYINGTPKTLAKVPTSTNYTTEGWFTDAECTKRATNISAADFGDKVYYAKRSNIGGKVIVEYVDAGGKVIEEFDVGQSATLRSIKAKNGYTIDGWYTGSDVKVTSINTSTPGVISLYAKYIPYKYTVHFFVDGVEDTSLKKVVSFDETFTLPSHKDGNLLTTVWYTARATTAPYALSGTTYAQGKTNVKNLSSTNNGSVNLYCKTYANIRWSFGSVSNVTAISPYEVKQLSSTSNYYLHKNSSMIKTVMQTENGIQKKAIYSTGTIPVDGREGYTFTGWNTKTNGTGIAFVYANSTEAISLSSVKSLVDVNGYLTLYAQFSANTVTINLKKNNADWTTAKTDGVSMKLVNEADTTKEYPFTIADGNSSFKVSAIPNGTYVVYMPTVKGGTVTSTKTYFGTITINNNSISKDLDYYSVTVNKGTGIASVNGGIGWIVKGGSRNISRTLTSGYTWVNWTGTKDGAAITASTSETYKISNISNAWVLTANAKK